MKLFIERGRTVELEQLPDWSIAIDGYVQGPAIDNRRHRYSFDHHRGCVRLVTAASCVQVRDAVLLGLEPDRFSAFVNDVDTDVALSIWALRHPGRLAEPRVERLFLSAGLLDAHGGAYPAIPHRVHLEWLAEPETRARRDGRYEALSTEGLAALLDALCERFDRLLSGEAPPEEALRAAAPPVEMEVLYEGTGWILVRSSDPHVLSHLYERGFERIVTCRPIPDGSFAYTIARRSDFIEGFDVPALIEALARKEPGWGGGSTIGGAPRNADGSRSRLPPGAVFDVIEANVRRQIAESP